MSPCPDSNVLVEAEPVSTGAVAPPAVRWVNPLEDSDWDSSVRSHPGSTFFHGAAWAQVLHETYGCKPAYAVGREGRRLLALLPCMELNSVLAGRRGVSLPFTDDAAPLVAHGAPFRALFDAVTAHGREEGWRTWECRGGAEWMPEARPSLSFHQHSLDLTGGETRLLSRLEPAVRRAIRKADRSGLDLSVEDSPAALDAFYALHCLTRRRHGVPMQPKAFFDNIHRHVLARGSGHIFLARHRGRAVAGAMFFEWDGKAAYKFGASDEAYQELRPNNAVMWDAIRFYAARGAATLDFGRTSLANEGLRRFKAGWGATESRLSYLKCDLRSGAFLADQDRASGWYTGCFRCLPTPALRVVGNLWYRHLA